MLFPRFSIFSRTGFSLNSLKADWLEALQNMRIRPLYGGEFPPAYCSTGDNSAGTQTYLVCIFISNN